MIHVYLLMIVTSRIFYLSLARERKLRSKRDPGVFYADDGLLKYRPDLYALRQ